MVSVKFFIAAAAAAIVSTAAHRRRSAAASRQWSINRRLLLSSSASGWYLRGDVGVGVQNFTTFDHSQTISVFVWPASWTHRPAGHPGRDHLRLRHRLRLE